MDGPPVSSTRVSRVRIGVAVAVSLVAIGSMLAYHDGLFDVDEAMTGLSEGSYRFRGHVCAYEAAEETVVLSSSGRILRLHWNATTLAAGPYIVNVDVDADGAYEAVALTPLLVFRQTDEERAQCQV